MLLAYFKCRHAPATPSAAHFPGPPPPVRKDARWADKHTQTTSEIGIQFSQISLQFALTKAGKHSITVYTGHNNILWSWAQRGEQEFLYLWAILQYKYAKHHNTSGPENQRLEIIASFFFFWKPISQSFQQQTLWKASKGMPFCSSLAMPYYILCTFFLSHRVLRFRHIKAPKGPNCLFFLFFFFPFFFSPLNMKNMKADTEAGPC